MSLFPPKIFGQYSLKALSKKELDDALQNGYFPTGLMMSTSVAALFRIGQPVKSRIYLRAPAKQLLFSKNQRKLIRRNSSIFNYKVRGFFVDEEINDLWLRFKKNAHNWNNTPPLQTHIFRDNSPQNFPAKILTIHRDSQLVAFSVFFEGNFSLSSLEAAFEQQYSKYSLGMYSMLLELVYANEAGLAYYYPGFVFKDVPMFQYKMRLKGLEYFQLKTKSWKEIDELSPEDWIFDEMKIKLASLMARMPLDSLSSKPFLRIQLLHDITPESSHNIEGYVPCIQLAKADGHICIYYQPLIGKYIFIEKRKEIMMTQRAEHIELSLHSSVQDTLDCLMQYF